MGASRVVGSAASRGEYPLVCAVRGVVAPAGVRTPTAYRDCERSMSAKWKGNSSNCDAVPNVGSRQTLYESNAPPRGPAVHQADPQGWGAGPFRKPGKTNDLVSAALKMVPCRPFCLSCCLCSLVLPPVALLVLQAFDTTFDTAEVVGASVHTVLCLAAATACARPPLGLKRRSA